MLNALQIENAKPKEKPYKLSDGNGLYLLVETGGSKLWRLEVPDRLGMRAKQRWSAAAASS